MPARGLAWLLYFLRYTKKYSLHMKFKVQSKLLYSTVSAVSKVINSKNALTILNNFHMRLEGDLLTITGSDVENALTAVVEVGDVEGEGEFCLDARRLVELLKEVPAMGLTFAIDDATLETKITYSGGEYSMVAIAGDQYPAYKKEADEEEPVVFTCPAQEITGGLAKTLFAVGTDDFHPQMMGVLMKVEKEKLVFVATDTRQLVLFENTKTQPGVEAMCIIPQKPAKVLQDAFADADTITVCMTSKSATITGGKFTFNCRFIKGRFPAYERVIPQNNPYTMTLDRGRFLNAVRRVSIFVDPGYGMIKFKISNDRLMMKSVDPNLQQLAQETIDCVYDGPELVIGFSAPFLTNILQNISTDEVVVALSDPSRAGVFRPLEQAEGENLLMLLMPMNVTEF